MTGYECNGCVKRDRISRVPKSVLRYFWDYSISRKPTLRIAKIEGIEYSLLALYPGGFPRRYPLAVKLLENRLYMTLIALYHFMISVDGNNNFGNSCYLGQYPKTGLKD